MICPQEKPFILLVVAHPDDETLWCGGTLLRLKDAGVPVAILSVTNASNAVRRGEFETACGMLGAEALMLDCPDGGSQPLPDFGAELDKIAAARMPFCVLTHASHGNERGHFQHRACYRIVRDWTRQRGVAFGVVSETGLRPLFGESGVAVHPHVTRMPLFSGIRSWANAVYRVWSRVKDAGRPVAPIGDWEGSVQLEIASDTAKKQRVMEAYRTQLSGLQQYATYHSKSEFIRFFDARAADTFGDLIGGP